MNLPFAGQVVHQEMAPGPLVYFLYFCGFALFVLTLFWVLSYLRREQGSRAYPLLLALAILLGGLVNDAVVILGLVDSVRVSDYAFLGIVALISFVLGEEARTASSMRRVLMDRERQLHETARMLQQVLDTIPVRVFWKDRESRYLGCNRLFAADSGFQKPDELIGLDDFAMGWREQARLYRADDAQVMSTEKPKLNYEEPQTTPEGDTIWLRTSKLPLRDAGGQVIGILGTYEDITEEHKLRELLRHSQKMEAVGQLAGGVAHDFNNLLHAIEGYTELALTTLDSEHPATPHLDEVRKAAGRAGVLTRRLLAFSRRQPLQQRLVDLGDVVHELLGMLRPTIGEQIELVIRKGEDLDPVEADPGQMEQVVLNLCVNARDAMPQGGRLIIDTRNEVLDHGFVRQHPWARVGSFVLLEVADTGHGMPQYVRERLFEPFFTTKENGEGTGLGLATVYAIVDRHQGLIDVSSTEGQGTSFRIYLPAASGSVDTAEEARAEPPSGGHETILVAEDEGLLRSLAVEVLGQAGYRLILARDGDEALALFEQNADEIDLAVLDVIMPKRTGRQVHERIRSLRPDLPVLFVSGYSYGTLEKEHLPEGGQNLIQKPYRSADLLHKVRKALDAAEAV
jgi:PAS domain S-box-containing protein